MNKESYRSVQKLLQTYKESLKDAPLWKSALEKEKLFGWRKYFKYKIHSNRDILPLLKCL